MQEFSPDEVFFPIVVVTRKKPARVVDVTGTGFLIAPHLFMTCWHCVKQDVGADHEYAIRVRVGLNEFVALPLNSIEHDRNGSDIALAGLAEDVPSHIVLANAHPFSGQNVWSYGFPFHEVELDKDGEKSFRINGRLFKSYVMRQFFYSHFGAPRTNCYELGMPAPEGLSGGPVLLDNAFDLFGIVVSGHDVELITDFASVDPDTAERTPERVRITSFAVAYDVVTVGNVVTGHTRDKPLREFLKQGR